MVFYAEAERIDTLRDSLDLKWKENFDPSIYKSWNDLEFVPYEARYHLFSNSNHRTARWLEELGCEVRGFSILSNFRLLPAEQ